MSGPFDGLTVVEFGQFVVVPFCTQLMADGGARVIKVEPRTGDTYRNWSDQLAPGESRQFLIKNRGKQSISVDLAHDRSPEVVRMLVEAADVVLVNLSPAAVARRGLDYESLKAINPRIVYGAVTAYGQVGPEAHLPGMDVVVQARSGLLSSLGAERDGVPLHSEVQVADYSSAMLLFGGIASALYVRERTGEGQRVDVSLLGGALAVQNNSLGHVHAQDDWRVDFVENRLPKLRDANAAGAEVEAERRALRPDPPSHTAHYRIFRTANGFLALGAGSAGARRRLCETVGLDPELADTDPEAFGRRLELVLHDRPSDEWALLLLAADVPVAKVRHIDEMLFDAHALEEGLVADYDHPVVGKYRGLGVPIRMSATPLCADRPSPAFAADTVPVLAEVGMDPAAIDSLLADGAVLDGRVTGLTHEKPRSM
jgi:crotonobetainyl-CoA:carnitine CoA-transferase CaiB-like acyl-CoA transferase